MQNLTKLILNNKIVEFRKPVRQSRIHCIRKLSREIKKLKEKKGTDKQKTKNLRKAERYVEEILAMKRLHDDEVSKFALSNERTLNDITNDVNESLEQKALARLAHHKSVAEKVQNFRETFPEWKSCLEFLLETLGEKYKHKKTIKSSKKKSKVKSRTLKVKENKTGTFCVEPISLKITTTSKCESVNDRTDEKLENDGNKEAKSERKLEKPIRKDVLKKKLVDESVVQKSIKKDVLEKKPVDENEVVEEPFTDHENEVSDTVSEEFSEECSAEKESNVHDADDSFFLMKDNASDISVSAKEFSEKCSPEKESDVEGAVDPFFLTINNAPYISVSAKKDVSSNQGEFNSEQASRQEFSRKSNFKHRESEPRQYGGRGLRDSKFTNKRKFPPTNFGDNRKTRRSEKITVEIERLHPSWEAKKKLSIACVPFQGKKIKFDDS